MNIMNNGNKIIDTKNEQSENQVIVLCSICGRKFQFGPNIYTGYNIPRYLINVCLSCWNDNSEGWALNVEDRILMHLEEHYLPVPERNEKGLLPRD